MSPRDRALWMRFQRRAAQLSPELSRELLAAYEAIRDSLSTAEIERLIQSGQVDAILEDALLDRSFRPLREKLQESVQRGFRAAIPDLPKKGKVDGQMAVGFDTLNPKVIDAVRSLDSRVVNGWKEEVRDVIRAHVENGLRDGTPARSIARTVKEMIGLSPSHEEAIRNYRKELEAGSKAALDRKLRDRRFDAATVKGDLSPEKVDRMVDAYRRRYENFNATTNAKTATLDSLRLGQRISWDDAIAKGIIKREQVWKRRTTVGDSRVREEHAAMNGEEVPFDAAYSNGEVVSGEASFNCRCTDRYFVRPQDQ